MKKFTMSRKSVKFKIKLNNNAHSFFQSALAEYQETEHETRSLDKLISLMQSAREQAIHHLSYTAPQLLESIDLELIKFIVQIMLDLQKKYAGLAQNTVKSSYAFCQDFLSEIVLWHNLLHHLFSDKEFLNTALCNTFPRRQYSDTTQDAIPQNEVTLSSYDTQMRLRLRLSTHLKKIVLDCPTEKNTLRKEIAPIFLSSYDGMAKKISEAKQKFKKFFVFYNYLTSPVAASEKQIDSYFAKYIATLLSAEIYLLLRNAATEIDLGCDTIPDPTLKIFQTAFDKIERMVRVGILTAPETCIEIEKNANEQCKTLFYKLIRKLQSGFIQKLMHHTDVVDVNNTFNEEVLHNFFQDTINKINLYVSIVVQFKFVEHKADILSGRFIQEFQNKIEDAINQMSALNETLPPLKALSELEDNKNKMERLWNMMKILFPDQYTNETVNKLIDEFHMKIDINIQYNRIIKKLNQYLCEGIAIKQSPRVTDKAPQQIARLKRYAQALLNGKIEINPVLLQKPTGSAQLDIIWCDLEKLREKILASQQPSSTLSLNT